MRTPWNLAVLALIVLVVAPSVAADPKFVPFEVRNILDRSLNNEREAVARYELCARKAEEEGYPGAAALFRAAARAEGIHAGRFEEAMRERGIPVPEPKPYSGAIGNTADNLRTSASAETSERDKIYREAIDTAKAAGDTKLAQVFDQTRDTEVEHANLMNAAVRQLDSYRQEKHFFVCDACGYTSDLDLPMCVLCRVSKHPHEVK